jgi:IS30 family transposase
MGKHYRSLSDWERTRIMVLKAESRSIREISRILLRAPSTISRELRRNGYKDSYSAALACKKSSERRKDKVRRLYSNKRLQVYVHGHLKMGGLRSKFLVSLNACLAKIHHTASRM